MTSTFRTRIVATGCAAVLTLVVFVLLVSVAQAAQPLAQLQRATGSAYATLPAAGPAGGPTGFGGVFDAVTRSQALITGGMALAALAISVIALAALDRSAGRREEPAPVTSIIRSPGDSPMTRHEDDRKAA